MGELVGYSFFLNALCGVRFIAVAAAMVGTYIVARRRVAISGGVTHACFGGLGVGDYVGVSRWVRRWGLNGCRRVIG